MLSLAMTLLDRKTVLDLLRVNGFQHLVSADKVYLFDNKYVPLDDKRCGAYFAKISKAAVSILGDWGEEFRDCDKLSRLTHSLAAATHAKSWKEGASGKNGGLAIGVFSFMSETLNARHSINTIITKINGKSQLRLRFFEPRNHEEIFLTAKEKIGSYFIML